MSERYEIKRRLGRGGIGAVYEGYDMQLDRPVAIKRLLPIEETHLNEADTGSLSREASALAKFQHPNVVTIFGFEEDDDGPFVVTELINGENLKMIVERGALSVSDFQEFVSQSLDAMIAAEQLSLLHRDIKPANLMLLFLPSGKFQVKILDFGLAKFSQTPSQQTLDHKGSFLGSIDYIAPEQIERQPLDLRTDLYSFGCVCYFALTQKPPFEGTNLADTMKNHLNHKVIPIGEIRSDLPPAIGDWVMKMISLRPEDRPASASVAVDEFEQAKLGVSPQTTGGVTGKTDSHIVVTPAPGTQPQAPKPASETGTQPTRKSGRVMVTGPMPPRNTTAIQLQSTGPRKTVTGQQTASVNQRRNSEKKKAGLIFGLILAMVAFIGVLIAAFSGGKGDDPEGKGGQNSTAGSTPATQEQNSAVAEKENENPSPQEVSGLPQPASIVPPKASAELAKTHALPVSGGLAGHYVASALTFQLDQKTPAETGDQVGSWGNFFYEDTPAAVRFLARAYKDTYGDNCPRLAYLGPGKFPSLNGPHHFIQFSKGDHLTIPAARPTDDTLVGRNLTVSLVFSTTSENGPVFAMKTDSDQEKITIVPKKNKVDTWVRTADETRKFASIGDVPGGQLYIATFRLDGDTQTLQLMNGGGKRMSSGKKPAPKRALAYTGYLVGSGSSTDQYNFTGHIAEVAIFSRTLTDDETTSLEDHLFQKYFKAKGNPPSQKGITSVGKGKGQASKGSAPVIKDQEEATPPVTTNLKAWFSSRKSVLTKEKQPAQPGDSVIRWGNLAPGAADYNHLLSTEKSEPPTFKQLWPKQFPELKQGTPVVSIRQGQNLTATTPKFPFSELSNAPISVVMLVRPETRLPPTSNTKPKLMTIGGKPSGTGADVKPEFFYNVTYSDDNVGFTMKTREPKWISTGAKRNSTGFSIVVVEWDPENAKHGIYNYSPDGQVTKSESSQPSVQGVHEVKQLVLGAPNNQQGEADYIEVLVYTKMLTPQERDQIRNWLGNRYFAN